MAKPKVRISLTEERCTWEEMVNSPRWARFVAILAEIAQNPKKEDAA